MNQVSSEIVSQRKRIGELERALDAMTAHAVSLEKRLYQEIECNDQYRAWFKNHEHVVTVREDKIVDESSFYEPFLSDLSPVGDFTIPE